MFESVLDKVNYCEDCEFNETCEIAFETEFCENCKDYVGCPCKSMCQAGYDVECNNGFELKSYYDDDEENEDDDIEIDVGDWEDGDWVENDK